jgi:hypothetical protein
MKRRNTVRTLLATGLGILPLVYALSVGPTARLALHLSGAISASGWWATLYRPLFWICERTGTGHILEQYVVWWCK